MVSHGIKCIKETKETEASYLVGSLDDASHQLLLSLLNLKSWNNDDNEKRGAGWRRCITESKLEAPAQLFLLVAFERPPGPIAKRKNDQKCENRRENSEENGPEETLKSSKPPIRLGNQALHRPHPSTAMSTDTVQVGLLRSIFRPIESTKDENIHSRTGSETDRLKLSRIHRCLSVHERFELLACQL